MIIEHVAMYVNDLERARDFFVKYLGVTHKFKFKSVKPGKYVYKVAKRTGYN